MANTGYSKKLKTNPSNIFFLVFTIVGTVEGFFFKCTYLNNLLKIIYETLSP